MTVHTNDHLAIGPLLRFASDGIFVVDHHRRFVVFNEVCERITGHAAAEIIGRQCPCSDTLDCHDDYGRPLWGILCPAKSLFDGAENAARQRMSIERKDGARVWVETIYTPIRDDSGRVEGILAVMRDVTEQKAREDEMFQMIQSFRENSGNAGPPPEPTAASASLDQLLGKVEADAIRRALSACGGRRHKAAAFLGISRSRLYRRMEALGIDPGEHE